MLLTGVAASAQSVAGTLTGRVTDANTKLALAGAHVFIRGTAIEGYTDATGGYVLTGVPAGDQSVEFGYVGYGEFLRSATVVNGQATRLDAAFGSDTVKMESFVINGSLVGTARAINQQRSAETLTNIIASDALGEFPDQNAAESLQRVPGLALYRDQGEGRFVIIRGINSQYNHVALNGASLATPESGSRNAPLDVIGTDSLGAVEVTKVTTPDMDPDGLGGSVNLRTRSAFDADGRQASLDVESLYSHLRDTYGYKVNATYGDVYLDGKLGVMLQASFQRRPYGSSNFEEGAGWSEVKSPTDGQDHFVFNEIAYREYQIFRTRGSANLNFDYKLAPTTTVSLRTSYADFDDKERRWVTDIPFNKGTLTALTDSTASFGNVTGISKRLRTREKDQRLMAATLGFDHKASPLALDGQLSASKGHETKPEELEGRFDTKAGANVSYAFTDPYRIVTTASGGIDLNNPANYTSVKGSLKETLGNETELGARGNARYDFESGAQKSYAKFGASYRAKRKDVNKDSYDIKAGPGYTFAALSEDGSQSLYPYYRGPRFNAAALESDFFQNQSAFTLAPKLPDSFISDFRSHEDVLAGYVMGGTTAGALNLIGGVRVENTRFSTDGFESRGTAINPASASANYTNWLPGITARYDASRRLVLRASWTNTLSRPDFTQTALSRTVNDTAAAPTVAQGNPHLKPLKSDNWDASVEYYLPSLGVISAAAFYKDIRDFSYQSRAGNDPILGYPLTTFVNGSKGHIGGVELAYQQQLRFLPAPFDGLGVLANATFSDSSAKYGERPGENLPFIGQSKTIGNLGLTYQKEGFFARLAANYRTPRLREDEPLGDSPDDDRYVDRFLQWDFTTSYRFARGVEVYVEAVNLTNEPFRVYFGGGGAMKKLVQFEEYDWSSNFGVRWKF